MLELKCIDCGKLFVTANSRAKRCHNCRQIHKNITTKEWLKKRSIVGGGCGKIDSCDNCPYDDCILPKGDNGHYKMEKTYDEL